MYNNILKILSSTNQVRMIRDDNIITFEDVDKTIKFTVDKKNNEFLLRSTPNDLKFKSILLLKFFIKFLIVSQKLKEKKSTFMGMALNNSVLICREKNDNTLVFSAPEYHFCISYNITQENIIYFGCEYSNFKSRSTYVFHKPSEIFNFLKEVLK